MKNDRLVCRPMLAVPLMLLVSVPVAACKQSAIKLYPVQGKVLFKDQPAEGAQVVFQPVGGVTPEAPMAYGTAGADGSFSLTTVPHGPGAAAGDYNVTIMWFASATGDALDAKSKLPAKYADSTKPIIKATVKAEKNELEPFALQP